MRRSASVIPLMYGILTYTLGLSISANRLINASSGDGVNPVNKCNACVDNNRKSKHIDFNRLLTKRLFELKECLGHLISAGACRR